MEETQPSLSNNSPIDASLTIPVEPNNANNNENTSDYGSDLDDAATTALLLLTGDTQLNASDDVNDPESTPLSSLALENIEELPPQNDRSCALRVSARLATLRSSSPFEKRKAPLFEVDRVRKNASGRDDNDQETRLGNYTEASDGSSGPVPNEKESTGETPDEQAMQSVQEPLPITTPTSKNSVLSPLARFRTPPKKPLSVTDLVSPAWCEQQYEYSLSKYGRVRRTPAMRQGSSVHRELENQVHVSVPVEVVSAEDRFGLRVWNAIQGLRTLRTTGLTRELEVWGVLEGEVVVGVIDEITTTCPDDDLEKKILDEEERNDFAKKKKGRGKKQDEMIPAADQPTLKQFLTSASQGGSVLEKDAASRRSLEKDEKISVSQRYYLVDTKTRQSNTLPAQGSRTRPMHMQLMLYHRLLSALAANDVPVEKIFKRYSLNPRAQFSDQFIAELSNLDIRSYDPPISQSDDVNDDNDYNDYNQIDEPENPDPLSELLEHNTLHSLWTLLLSEYARTFSQQPSFQASSTTTTATSPNKNNSTNHNNNINNNNNCRISSLLTVEFRSATDRIRSANTQDNNNTKNEEEKLTTIPAGALLGRRSFPFQPDLIAAYIADEMRWWRGERPTRGVEVEEAFKCGLCEFADNCEWRATKVHEGIRRAKIRQEERSRRNLHG